MMINIYIDAWQQPWNTGAMQELQKYIRTHGLNQAEFARLVGLSESAVCRWLSGQRVPQYQALKRLAAATGISVEKIARGFE